MLFDLRSTFEFEPFLLNSQIKENKSENQLCTELPEMNMAWVANPSNTLFSVLTRYERFLIYLNYKEGLGVRQISERLGRAKDTIHSHLQQAIKKLIEQYERGEQGLWDSE